MIELMIGLITILILVAGIVQFVSLSQAYCTMDGQIRSNAGVVAMSSPAVDTPQYILDWQIGSDGQHMTADDKPTTQTPTMFGFIADKTATSNNAAADWAIFSQLSQPSSLAALYQNPNSIVPLGFVGVRYSKQVPVLDILQELVYNRASVQVQEDCWMPVMKGLY